MGTVISVILLCIILVFLWLQIDFALGKKQHLNKVNKREFPFRQSNIELFIYGGKLFTDLFTEIEAAKQHIHILFYIVKNDQISLKFFSLLEKKALEGVEVRLLVDRIGGKHISNKQISALKNSGAMFAFCHKPKLPYLFYSFNERNHRKISVIDGKIGYLGGFNVGKEYLGHNPSFGVWRDYHLKMTGEGVQDLQTQFLLDWELATKQNLLVNKQFFPLLEKGLIRHKLIPTDGAFLKERFLEIINNANREIVIGTPYFIPGKEIKDALLSALKRGVKVKVLVPMKADHAFVKEAAFPYFKTLIKSGCEVYRFYYGFYHAKVIMVDGVFSDIGTANFDKRSLHLNHEFNCFIYDERFSQQVRDQLYSDIEKSELLTLAALNKRSIFEKGKDSFSTLISDLL